jgi:putative transposase
MAHTYVNNFVHCIFSTKERANIIPDNKREQLWAYFTGIAKNADFATLAVGGTANRVHVLILLPASIPLAEAVKKLKGSSSKWMGPHFCWQEGYGAFSVSPSQLPAVKDYIAGELEHHKRRISRKNL